MQLQEIRSYDVVVCGCGVAGFCAAVAAGRAGARVALVERQGMPGGILTVGGNNDVALFFAHKQVVIRGIGWAFCEELARRGDAVFPDWRNETRHPALGVKVNPLAAAVLMDEWLLEAGAALYYNQPVVDVEWHEQQTRRVLDQVVVASKNGLIGLEAKVFIDATGDGDLCAFAGAEIECGDPETGALMPGTLRYYQQSTALTAEQRRWVERSFAAARADGRLQRRDLWSEDNGGTPLTFYDAQGDNVGHVMDYNPADSDSLTQAEVRGRQSVYRVARWIRENGLGGEIITAAPHVASRESRRVVCDARITGEDYVSGKRFDDAVCYSFYPIDLHRADGNGLYNIFLAEGVVPTLPLSMLIPRRLQNVLVAGRCRSMG